MDLIEALIDDHQKVKRLFGELTAATGEQREELFCELREDLIRHEVAEEEIVRPLTKSSVPGGAHIADERIAEESEAEGILKKMEKLEVGAPEWQHLLETLRTAVLQHAEKEETLEFPKLRSGVDSEELASKGHTFESAKQMAPTHPHPHSPNTPAANMALGPVAAIVDRARDALSRARSA